jgi:hypothetical protein
LYRHPSNVWKERYENVKKDVKDEKEWGGNVGSSCKTEMKR